MQNPLRHLSSGPSRLLLTVIIFACLLTVVTCRDDENPPLGQLPGAAPATASAGQAVVARPSATPTITLTPAPTNTPRPTRTPTITPTPTATAPLIVAGGNPLAVAIHEPAPQAGAPCGVVDLLDFPLDPPDALNISRGGQDFGVFRNRYDGYHAGEDWWGPGGRRGSFGEPVYSIGHGQVTFAHPYGWGIDQGTVIIRHIYPDGREFYSFYGHLDPPSVDLAFNQCVSRGQKIAEIGRPRGSPHLHFEIRNHTSADPGPGYWSHDPRRSGWLAPSQTISDWRIAASPGVTWQRPNTEPGLQGTGLWQTHTLVALAGSDVVGLNLLDGALRWRFNLVQEAEDDDELLSPLAAAAFDAQQPILYAADRNGRISALNLPQEAAQGAPQQPEPRLLWDLQLHNVRGAPHLFPLPSGGVVLLVQRRMIAFTSAGALLWREPFDAQPVDSLVWQDNVLLSAAADEAELWELSPQGRRVYQTNSAGRLIESGGQLFLYDAQAVHRLNPQTMEDELFFELPDGLATQSDIMALPDGGLLLAHKDAAGRRLLALDAGGALRWQRAYDRHVDGKAQLLLSGSQPYLFSEESSGSWSRVFLHRIDMQNEQLTLVFSGGTRTPLPGTTWLFAADLGQFLINIGGGSLVALDAGAALQVVCAGSAPLTC